MIPLRPHAPPPPAGSIRVLLSLRRGDSMVEVIVFLATFSATIFTAFLLLFGALENRLLQQTMSLVEQNGTLALQSIAYRIQEAEQILDPPAGATARLLALQTNAGTSNPTIIGVQSGSFVMIRSSLLSSLTSPHVRLEDFVVRNTSPSPSRQSFAVSFRVTRTIQFRGAHTYSQPFEALFTLPPADQPMGGSCGCAPPSCSGGGAIYTWEICPEGSCVGVSTPLPCGNAP